MYSNLKYNLLTSCLICAVGMLISCSSAPDDDLSQPKGSEVSFDVSEMSRAPISVSFNQFAVYGDMKFPANGNASPSVVFDKTTVEFARGNWTYRGEPRYWFPNHEHSFVAVTPLSVLETDNNSQYSNSKLSFTYTLPISDEGRVNYTDVADIIAATYRRVYYESSSDSEVELKFSHILSLINFSVELTEPSARSEESFKIHKFEMSGFGNSAAINIKPAPRLDNHPQTDDSEIDILTAKGSSSLTVAFDEPIEVINGAAAVKMFDDNNAIIMLPQTFAANEEVKIRLTYSVNNEEESIEVSASLSGFKWESGKSYNYNIKLELGEAKEANMTISNTTIAPWIPVDGHDEVDAK